ncbi:ATP-binding cassette domain-containing protein [Agrobacterium tumefaciens]|uniref:ABC transporter ATP-binding protein n=1 Tax=Agrobacterium tumefaciens TaxID=358 RepID=UPI00287EFCA1|nr:ATP-binding cassette domain-containing protein [Agrobacterium tumefaciens]MDS7595655.1 ATP-binding cassette domain-containing protein [Agrobacterium tumefaciens]
MNLLSVEGLTKTYRSASRTVDALSEITFSLQPGETLGLAGPSGCGKSTLARVLMRLISADEGLIRFEKRDWLSLEGKALREARPRMQMVFQDTHGAFNPLATVASAIGEPLRIHGIVPKSQRRAEIHRLLDRVGLPEVDADRSVFALSGGQRQRVAIARALSLRPSLLILDEAVSALDVSVRRQILELLVEIQKDTAVACLFVSHDLAVINAICHRVAIMEAGRIVEIGDTGKIIATPQSSAARALIHAAPRLFMTT